MVKTINHAPLCPEHNIPLEMGMPEIDIPFAVQAQLPEFTGMWGCAACFESYTTKLTQALADYMETKQMVEAQDQTVVDEAAVPQADGDSTPLVN